MNGDGRVRGHKVGRLPPPRDNRGRFYWLFTDFAHSGRMKKKIRLRKIKSAPHFLSRQVYWLVLAILCPMLLAFLQTYRTAEMAVYTQSERILDFFMGEAENTLGETERTIDGYLLQTQGSCAAEDLLLLRRELASNNAIVAAGVVAADGKIACSIGEEEFDAITFPAYKSGSDRKIEFAELHVEQDSLPVLAKAGANGIRVYAVVSHHRFKRMLLPSFIANYSQIDVILPAGGLWYSVAGSAVADGFTGKTMLLEQKSQRFPVKISSVSDKRAIAAWSGELRTSFIIIIFISFSVLALCFVGHRFYRVLMERRLIQRQMIQIEHARLNFEIMYQPLMNVDSKLLVGVVVNADVSLFEKVPQAKPGVDEILATIWSEIGEFAQKRREFNIIVRVDGEAVVAGAHRPAVIRKLKEIGYNNLTLLMDWENDRGVDPDVYRPLEEVATAGANLAIDCGNVQFSLLSDMWAWPYHQLVVDFAKLPDSEEAANWMSEIVMNMSEQLQIGTVAIGLHTRALMESAVGGGFRVGAGRYYGPPLTIGTLMAAVRPVRKQNLQAGGNEREKAA